MQLLQWLRDLLICVDVVDMYVVYSKIHVKISLSIALRRHSMVLISLSSSSLSSIVRFEEFVQIQIVRG